MSTGRSSAGGRRLGINSLGIPAADWAPCKPKFLSEQLPDHVRRQQGYDPRGPFKMTFITKMSHIKSLQPADICNYVVVYQPNGEIRDDFRCLDYPTPQNEQEIAILFITGPIVIDTTLCYHTLIFRGNPLGPELFLANTEFDIYEGLCYPSQAWESIGAMDNPDPALDGVFKAEVRFVVCTARELLLVLRSTKFSQEEKLLSAYYLLFPYIKTMMHKHFTPIPFRVLTDDDFDRLDEFDDVDKNKLTSLIQGYTAVCVLAPSYSLDKKLGTQIYNRLKAGCAKYDYVCPKEDDIKSYLTGMGWKSSFSDGNVSQAIGWIVGVDINGVLSSETPKANLKSEKTLVEENQLSEWGAALLDQARMVYSHYHATSIRFGGMVLKLVEKFFRGIGPKWVAEADDMLAIQDDLNTKPFTGCAKDIDVAKRVKSVCRLSYIGLLHYKAALKTPEEKANFEFYNVTKIRDHIDPPEDIDVCDAIAKVLPAKSLISIAMVLDTAELVTCPHFTAGKTPDELQSIYYYLCDIDSDGPWREREKALREKRERQRVIVDVENVIRAKFEQFAIGWGNAIRAMPLGQNRDDEHQLYVAWSEEVNTRLADLQPFEDRVVQASLDEFEQLRNELVALHKGLFEFATRRP